ncbi:MAG: hypothetical protein IPG64_15840 [Haliea sp.]|nr:hypothetical protein [Haliea sp.]
MTASHHLCHAPRWICKAVAWLMLSAATSMSFASSVKQFTFEELCDKAQLIFEGRVIASETRYDDSRAGFATYIRFEVLDHLKGPKIAPEIELRFAGGKIGDRQLSVGDMVYPEVGQVGIFFVESFLERQINPLLGWSQGHFVERTDEEGHTGIFTSEGMAVLSVQPGDSSTRQDASSEFKVVPGTASATGLEIAPWKSPDVQAISAQAFKEMIVDNVSE